MDAQGLEWCLKACRLENAIKPGPKPCKLIDFPMKSIVFHWFPGQNFTHWNRWQPTYLPQGHVGASALRAVGCEQSMDVAWSEFENTEVSVAKRKTVLHKRFQTQCCTKNTNTSQTIQGATTGPMVASRKWCRASISARKKSKFSENPKILSYADIRKSKYS